MAESITFTILSADGAELVLESPDPDTYQARLRGEGIDATVAVFHDAGDFIGAYFSELAANWRGWDGERSWRSLEDALEFHASISKSGAVTLRVCLRNSDRFTWCVTYDFSIENGSLDALAEAARAFGQLLGAATQRALKQPSDSRKLASLAFYLVRSLLSLGVRQPPSNDFAHASGIRSPRRDGLGLLPSRRGDQLHPRR